MKKELEQSSGNPHAYSYYADCLLALYIKLGVLEEVINLTYPKKSIRYIATKLLYDFPQEEEGGGESKMEITCEVLQKIEDKLWENLEELNKDEKKLIEHRNSSFYTRCHFSDSYKYISCINLLKGLKEVVNNDKNYIKYYGLEEFETEEDKDFPLIVDYTINDDAEIVINTTLGIFHIPPHLFEEIVKKANKKGYLKVSLQFIREDDMGAYYWKFEMKPKIEEGED